MQREAKPVFNCKTKWFMHGALPCLCEHVAFIVLSPSPNARLGLPTLCWSMVTFKMRSLAGILGGGGVGGDVNLSEMSPGVDLTAYLLPLAN